MIEVEDKRKGIIPGSLIMHNDKIYCICQDAAHWFSAINIKSGKLTGKHVSITEILSEEFKDDYEILNNVTIILN